jgi:aconitate hydratase
MGFSPNSGGVSLRTFNRNFHGRSGTKDGQVYLVSPETAAWSAIQGCITDPTEMDVPAQAVLPSEIYVTSSGIVQPLSEADAKDAEVLRGSNIKQITTMQPMGDTLEATAVLKVGDNITTDHIMPAGAKILPYRSNIPKLSEFCFEVCDPQFPKRAMEAGQGIIIGGNNYGQGSSREHAALVPAYLGIRCVIAKSFARIHKANLINAGILPLTFQNPEDYEFLNEGNALKLADLKESLLTGKFTVSIGNTGKTIEANCETTERERRILLCGGLLNYTGEGGK